MTSRLPLFTIITPCLNGERYIVDAIESVLKQNYANCEHIVLDGGSTDGTSALLERYPHLTVVRDRDDGSHDAMNAGIARASGDIVGFLNVDDIYPAHTFFKVAAAFAANPGADVVVGDSIVFEETDTDRRAVRFIFKHPRGIWLPECLFGNPAINGCFYRRPVFEKLGLFENRYTITADRDFFIRMALADVKSVALNKPAIWYRAHGRSQTINRERSNILQIASELSAMASQALASNEGTESNKGPRVDRRLAHAWLAFESARLIFIRLRCRQLSEAMRLLLRHAALWPHLMRAVILRRIARRTYRGGWNADLSGLVNERSAFDTATPRPDVEPGALGIAEGRG
jgi:glycosyltransferase involved in cell wall biosynthesis